MERESSGMVDIHKMRRCVKGEPVVESFVGKMRWTIVGRVDIGR